MKQYHLFLASAVIGFFSLGRASAENLFISNDGSYNYQEMGAGGTMETYTSTHMSCPTGIGSSGNFFAANGSGKIQEFSCTGALVTTFADNLSDPNGFAFDGAGNIYIAAENSSMMGKFAKGGIDQLFSVGPQGAKGLAIDGSGNIYVTNSLNNKVIEISHGGTVTTFASNIICNSSSAPPSGTMSVYTPPSSNGFTFDSNGNLCETDTNDNTVTEFDPSNNDPFVVGDAGGNPPSNVGDPSIAPVPEPSTYALMASGLALLVFLSRRKARKE
jgi:hypothetical protein